MRCHRLRAERALGHKLPSKAVVHHADGSKQETAPLVICPDQGYHLELHRKMRVRAAGGNPWTSRICSYCQQVKPWASFWRVSSHPKNRSGFSTTCKPCELIRRMTRRRLQSAHAISQTEMAMMQDGAEA